MVYADGSLWHTPKTLLARNVTGAVFLDNDKIGHTGFQRQLGHQIEATDSLQRKIPIISGTVARITNCHPISADKSGAMV